MSGTPLPTRLAVGLGTDVVPSTCARLTAREYGVPAGLR